MLLDCTQIRGRRARSAIIEALWRGTARAAKCDPCCRPVQSHRIDGSLATGSGDEHPGNRIKGNVEHSIRCSVPLALIPVSQPTRSTRNQDNIQPASLTNRPRCKSQPSPASWRSPPLPAPPPSTARCRCGTMQMPPARRTRSSTQRARASPWAPSTPATQSPLESTARSSNCLRESLKLPCSAVSLPNKGVHLLPHEIPLKPTTYVVRLHTDACAQTVQLYSDAECKELVTDESQKCVTDVKSYRIVRL